MFLLLVETLNSFVVLCCKVHKVQEQSVKSWFLSALRNVLVNDSFYIKIRKKCYSKNCHRIVNIICRKYWFKLPINVYFFLSKLKNNNLTSCLNNFGLVLTVHVKILSHRMVVCLFCLLLQVICVVNNFKRQGEVLVMEKEMVFLPKT